MQYKKRVIKAGVTMSQEIYAVSGPREKGKSRAPREMPTPEAVARYNEKMAEKKLRLLLNHNFGPEDYHLTVTYDLVPEREQAQKHLSNFLKRCSRHCKKNGSELRYIHVTEWRQKRIHHHIVMGGLDAKEAAKLWQKHGWARFTYLDASGDYKGLADYLIKETKQSLRDGLISRRWTSSRNLKQPIVKESIVKRWTRLEDTPKEYKNYALMDWYTTVNPVTGYLSQQAFYLQIKRSNRRTNHGKTERRNQ